MNNEDKRISELYTELYGSTHASEELRGKVRTMTESSSKRGFKVTFKAVIAAAAAIALLTVAGGAIASATGRANLATAKIVFNGEERKVYYEDYGDYSDGSNCYMYMWYFVKDGMDYGVSVYGNFDPETQMIYLEDRGDYVIASDSPNPELNLYEGIESSPCAEIEEDSGFLKVYTSDNHEHFMKTNIPSIDKDDGVADGVIHNCYSDRSDEISSVVTVLSTGAIAEAWKEPHVDEDEDYEVYENFDDEILGSEDEISEN